MAQLFKKKVKTAIKIKAQVPLCDLIRNSEKSNRITAE
jgi:hypothetical protein